MLPFSRRTRERWLQGALRRLTATGAAPRMMRRCSRLSPETRPPQRIWNERYEIRRRQHVDRQYQEDADAEAAGRRAGYRAPEFLARPFEVGRRRDEEAQVLHAGRPVRDSGRAPAGGSRPAAGRRTQAAAPQPAAPQPAAPQHGAAGIAPQPPVPQPAVDAAVVVASQPPRRRRRPSRPGRSPRLPGRRARRQP